MLRGLLGCSIFSFHYNTLRFHPKYQMYAKEMQSLHGILRMQVHTNAHSISHSPQLSAHLIKGIAKQFKSVNYQTT